MFVELSVSLNGLVQIHAVNASGKTCCAGLWKTFMGFSGIITSGITPKQDLRLIRLGAGGRSGRKEKTG